MKKINISAAVGIRSVGHIQRDYQLDQETQRDEAERQSDCTLLDMHVSMLMRLDCPSPMQKLSFLQDKEWCSEQGLIESSNVTGFRVELQGIQCSLGRPWCLVCDLKRGLAAWWGVGVLSLQPGWSNMEGYGIWVVQGFGIFSPRLLAMH